MPLDPHHFQQWDRHRKAQLDARLRAVAPTGWGLLECRIDEDRLSNGEAAVAECRAVLPDGHVVDVPDTSPTPDVRDVQAHLPSTEDTIRLLLAVPARRPSGRNVQRHDSSPDRTPRFVAERARHPDENTGDNERPMELARTHVQLRFASESQDGYTTLPLAEIERSGSGFRLTDAFVPPCVHCRASERLTALAHNLLERVVARRRDLVEHRDGRGVGTQTDGADVLRLDVLSDAIPALRTHTNGTTHPRAFFRTLVRLAARLTPHAEEGAVRPRDLPTYDHAAPTAPFAEVETILRDLLGGVTPSSNVERIALDQRRDTLLVGSAERSMLDQAQFYLVVRSEDHADSALRDRLAEMLRVASPDTIDEVLRSYTQALTVEPAGRLPSRLPVDAAATYFTLQKQGPYWDAIREEEEIAVFVPSEFQELDVDLLAVA
jgi:type VI secretion system protein ImpJ